MAASNSDKQRTPKISKSLHLNYILKKDKLMDEVGLRS